MRVEHVMSVDGTRIAYERAGSGTPLVLVHGTSVERFSFRLVQPLLTDRFTVYAVDRRGRGESGDAANGYSIDQEFADIASLVDSIDEPADLFRPLVRRDRSPRRHLARAQPPQTRPLRTRPGRPSRSSGVLGSA
jgi:alpha-beta hydrolase superfamily lysophospholipase